MTNVLIPGKTCKGGSSTSTSGAPANEDLLELSLIEEKPEPEENLSKLGPNTNTVNVTYYYMCSLLIMEYEWC